MILQLLGIEARMNEAKINDNHVGYQKSLRVDKHLKRLVCISSSCTRTFLNQDFTSGTPLS